MNGENLPSAPRGGEVGYRVGDLLVAPNFLYVVTGHKVKRMSPAAGFYYRSSGRSEWVGYDAVIYYRLDTSIQVLR